MGISLSSSENGFRSYGWTKLFWGELICENYLQSPIQGDSPRAGKLAFQSGVLHDANTSVDPLERLFPGSTYTFGGSQRYTTSIATAIQAFTDREYPDVGGKGLKIVPDLPRPQDGITWEDLSKHCVAEKHGGLVQGRCQNSKPFRL